MDPVHLILGLLCFGLSSSLEDNHPTTTSVEPPTRNRRDSGDGYHVKLLKPLRPFSNDAVLNNFTTIEGTVMITLNSSSWKMKLQPRTMFKGNNASFIFLEWAGWEKAPQILFDHENVQLTFPTVTNLVMVISNRISPNVWQFVENETFSITFNNTGGLKTEDVICAYLVINNCTAKWSSDGCLTSVNGTNINCKCTRFSIFVVLEKIHSIQNIADSIKEFAADLHNTTSLPVTSRVKIIEDKVEEAAPYAAMNGEMRIKTNTLEAVIQARNRNNLPKEPARLSTENAVIELRWDAFEGLNNSKFVYIMVIAISAENFTKIFGSTTNTTEHGPTLGSDVVIVSIGRSERVQLSSPITIDMKLNKNETQMKDSCVFWDNEKSSWAPDGCSVFTSNWNQTTCQCTHLTSFAVLLSQVPIPYIHEKNLEMITYVGIVLSLVCLLMSIVIFTYCRSIRNVRITIHTHLCLTMFLAEFLFLINSLKVANETLCTIVAISLHYLFLACFSWMLLEGVQLYLMVVKVFHSRSLRKTYLFLVGYGAPLIIVIPVAANGADAYDKRICWLNIKSGYLWAFMGPMCAIIGLNIIFFIITIWKLADKFSLLSSDVPHFQKVRSFTFTALGQLILLGGTWIFGIFHFNNNTIAMAYIFTVTNSFQGVFIFVLHCLINKQIRTELRNRLCKGTVVTSTTKQTHQTSHGTDNLTTATNVYS